MFYRALADGVLLIHLAFVLFVVAGGFLALWRPSLRWVHLPAAAWGAIIEFTGWICPLTPWEQTLRLKAGQVGYTGGFIERYLLPLLYPERLTPALQVWLGVAVLVLNVAIYAFVAHRLRRNRLAQQFSR
jgi:hypothetical protein